MKTAQSTYRIQIDDCEFSVKPGQTIFQVAEAHQVYIPHLCAHKDLQPFGGCRMCLVEVQGIRNFVPACTTPAENGMKVRTKTPEVQHLRREILELILSEHPSSCLFCSEGENCGLYMDTLRKVGIITGCRTCPSDHQCELQDVLEYVGVSGVEFPLVYREYMVEDYDPFYDRDYNLCILCGRCIGMCHQYRLADVLTFKHRGHETMVGPAFDRSHIEAGCEFCGSCVAICPTGTLSEKTRRWEGKADRAVQTTCPFCGLGCQLQLLVKRKEVMGSQAAEDDLINQNQLCVKGRFAAYETLNHPERLTVPYHLVGEFKQVLPWDEALHLAAEKLTGCKPTEFVMLVSADCTNEELYLAQKFTRTVMRSGNIDTSTRNFYSKGFNTYLELLKMSVPLSRLEKARIILAVGLDTRYSRSVVGVKIKKALLNGARLISIHPREHNLALHADHWLQPLPGEEAKILENLLALVDENPSFDNNTKRRKPGELEKTANLLRNGRRVTILLGSEFLQYKNAPRILTTLRKLALRLNAEVMPLPVQANLVGSIQMGCYPELLPGGVPLNDAAQRSLLETTWGVRVPSTSNWNSTDGHIKPKVLYVVGDAPLLEVDEAGVYTQASFIIYQNFSSIAGLHSPALILPAAAFAEMDGTFTNGEGRLQAVNKAVDPPGWAIPGWEILTRLAQAMGKPGFDYTSPSQVRREISQLSESLSSFKRLGRKASPPEFTGKLKISKQKPASIGKETWLLYSYPDENTYQGIPLVAWVGGMQMIFDDQCVNIHPDDARSIGVSEEDLVLITSENGSNDQHLLLERSVRFSDTQPRGTLSLLLSTQGISGYHKHPYSDGLPIIVSLRKKNV